MPSVIERCPNCLSTSIEMVNGFIVCKTPGCGHYSWPTKLCEKVPVFDVVREEFLSRMREPMYKRGDVFYMLAGFAPGCGRPVPGGYCIHCRSFLPELTEAKTKRGKASVRDGKAAAAGDSLQ